MFDIGFPELLIISVVALLVIGPEKLPETIRTISLWIGRFRRSFANIKQEIEKEISADEIRSQLYNESIMEEIAKSKEAFNEVKDSVNSAINDVGNSAAELQKLPEQSRPADEKDTAVAIKTAEATSSKLHSQE